MIYSFLSFAPRFFTMTEVKPPVEVAPATTGSANTEPKFRLAVLPEASRPLDFHGKLNCESLR
jgi:hypothetical protein